MIDPFSLPMMLFYAALYGITMKVADMSDEHGLKLFPGNALIFGVLCGIFGALLVVGNVVIANVILAMNIAFIIRRRIDYLNHAVAITIIIASFLFYGVFNPVLFIVFYFIFLIAGGLKDYADDTLKKKGLSFILSEAMLYYPIPTLIYCLIYGNWIVFSVFLIYTIFYNLTKYCGIKHGYK